MLQSLNPPASHHGSEMRREDNPNMEKDEDETLASMMMLLPRLVSSRTQGVRKAAMAATHALYDSLGVQRFETALGSLDNADDAMKLRVIAKGGNANAAAPSLATTEREPTQLSPSTTAKLVYDALNDANQVPVVPASASALANERSEPHAVARMVFDALNDEQKHNHDDNRRRHRARNARDVQVVTSKMQSLGVNVDMAEQLLASTRNRAWQRASSADTDRREAPPRLDLSSPPSSNSGGGRGNDWDGYCPSSRRAWERVASSSKFVIDTDLAKDMQDTTPTRSRRVRTARDGMKRPLRKKRRSSGVRRMSSSITTSTTRASRGASKRRTTQRRK